MLSPVSFFKPRQVSPQALSPRTKDRTRRDVERRRIMINLTWLFGQISTRLNNARLTIRFHDRNAKRSRAAFDGRLTRHVRTYPDVTSFEQQASEIQGDGLRAEPLFEEAAHQAVAGVVEELAVI